MRRRGPHKLLNREIALAFELRTEGCGWKVIAEGLGVNADYLCRVVNQAKNKGMR